MSEALQLFPLDSHYYTSAKNGVGYGAWAHIDGWSEAVIEYIREPERSGTK